MHRYIVVADQPCEWLNNHLLLINLKNNDLLEHLQRRISIENLFIGEQVPSLESGKNSVQDILNLNFGILRSSIHILHFLDNLFSRLLRLSVLLFNTKLLVLVNQIIIIFRRHLTYLLLFYFHLDELLSKTVWGPRRQVLYLNFAIRVFLRFLNVFIRSWFILSWALELFPRLSLY